MDKTIREYFSQLGKKGGKSRMASMTPEERSILGKKGMAARWGKTLDKEDGQV